MICRNVNAEVLLQDIFTEGYRNIVFTPGHLISVDAGVQSVSQSGAERRGEWREKEGWKAAGDGVVSAHCVLLVTGYRGHQCGRRGDLPHHPPGLGTTSDRTRGPDALGSGPPPAERDWLYHQTGSRHLYSLWHVTCEG